MTSLNRCLLCCSGLYIATVSGTDSISQHALEQEGLAGPPEMHYVMAACHQAAGYGRKLSVRVCVVLKSCELKLLTVRKDVRTHACSGLAGSGSLPSGLTYTSSALHVQNLTDMCLS